MGRRTWVRGYRLVFALIALVAVAVQFRQSYVVRGFPPANFFSFFTIQSNLLAIAVLLWGALRPPREGPSRRRDLARGAATTSMTITGVVYGLLLSGYQQELQTTIPWVDSVLHRAIPLVMAADWLLDPPSAPIAYPRALVWLSYPLLYAAYSLVRGPLVGWYPYPFFNPELSGGYGGVALYCLAIALGGLLFVWLVVAAGRRVRLVAAW